MTIAVHEGSSVIVPTLGSDRPFNPLVLHAVSHTFEEMLACAQLIAFGVLERHPDLRVVFLESSGGWVPFWLERLDEQAESFGGFCPELRLAPSEYFARQCWISYEIDEQTLPALAPVHRRASASCGDRTTRTTTPPSPARWTRCARTMAPLAAGAQAKILGANAAELYRLPRPPSTAAALTRCSATSSARPRHATGTPPLYVTPDGSELSYAALDRLSDEVAAGLAARGVRAGDVVALLLPSGPAYAVAYAAAAKIGAVTAGVNDRLSPPERRRCLAVARPRLVVTTEELGRRHRRGRRWPRWTTSSRSTPTRPRARRRRSASCAPVTARPTPNRPAAAGPRPARGRGVHVGDDRGAQGRGVHVAPARGHRRRRRRAGGGAAAGRGLSSTSFAHLGYMTKLPQALRGGGTTFLMGRWSAGDALEMVERHRITTLGGIPTQVALMLRHERFDSTDTSSVRMIAMGGGPSTAALVREARARFGVPVVVRYTCTEAGVGVGTAARRSPRGRRGDAWAGPARASSSPSAPTTTGRCRRASSGHVCLRSPAVMRGYWRDPEATAAVFTADGAVRTGDLGYRRRARPAAPVGTLQGDVRARRATTSIPSRSRTCSPTIPAWPTWRWSPRPDPVMGEIGVAVVVARARRGGPHPGVAARPRPGPARRLQAARGHRRSPTSCPARPWRRSTAPWPLVGSPRSPTSAGPAPSTVPAPAMSSSSGVVGSSTAARMASAISLALQHLVAQQPVGHPLLEGLAGDLGVPVVGERRRRVAHRHAQHPQAGLLGPQRPGQFGQRRLGGAVDPEPRPGHAHRVGGHHHDRVVGARGGARARRRTTRAAPTRLVASISCHSVGRRLGHADERRAARHVQHARRSRPSTPPPRRPGVRSRPRRSRRSATPAASPPAPRISSAASSTSASRRAASATRAPAAPAATARARPMPDDAPTTSTRRPSRLAGAGIDVAPPGRGAGGTSSSRCRRRRQRRAERSAANLTAPSGSPAVA